MARWQPPCVLYYANYFGIKYDFESMIRYIEISIGNNTIYGIFDDDVLKIKKMNKKMKMNSDDDKFGP